MSQVIDDAALLRWVLQQHSIRDYRHDPIVDRGITVWRWYARAWRLYADCQSVAEADAIAAVIPRSVVSTSGPPTRRYTG